MTEKLSQFTNGGIPARTAFLAGANAGSPNLRYTVGNVFAGMVPPMLDAGIVYVPGLSGTFTYTIPNNVWHVVFNGTMTLTSGTITMPSSPIDGQVVRFKTMQTIEGLTLSPNAGQSLVISPSTLGANTYFEATYDLANTTWYVEFIADALITLTAPLTLYVSIWTFTLNSGGSGYVNGSYINGTYLAVPLTGGSGSGITADITVSGNAVTAVVPVSAGTGYVAGDVLGVNNANLGGSGSGFQITLNTFGNDLQTGTTLATAFRTLTRANQEIASFNLAQGWAVTVNVSDGRYDEHPQLATLVGSSIGQITWNGNTSAREQCHIKPTTTLGFAGVIGFNNVIGHTFKGFWIDGQDPGWGGWQAIEFGTNCNNAVQTCRLSIVANDGWNVIEAVGGGTLNIQNLTIDWAGTQASFFTASGGSNLIINGTITLLSAVPDLRPDGGAFFEITGGCFVNVNIAASGWIGWSGTHGSQASIQAGSSIQTLYGDITTIPGDSDTITFTGSTSTFGPVFDNSTNVDPGVVAFGMVNHNYVTAVGTNTNLPASRTATFWSYDNTANVTGDANYFLIANDTAIGGTGIFHGLERFRHVTAASYQMVLGDLDRRIEMDNAGANTFTIPSDTTFATFGESIPLGGSAVVTQAGAGATTIAAGAGVTVHNAGVIPSGQWGSVTIYRRGTNEWAVTQV